MLILASSREGWANVLLEAMACGTPVVATRIWGTPEVVSTPAAGLLVEERSAAALARSVLCMLATPCDRLAVRRHAEGFSWSQTSQQQLELFRRLVRTGPLAGVDATGAGHA
jgi:glycosyltransferase involved in cell wall biosynthesis